MRTVGRSGGLRFATMRVMDEIGLDAATMNLDEFLLARIAEDKRVAMDAAGDDRQGRWTADAVGDGPAGPHSAEHVVRHDPARVLAECAAKRRIVQACRGRTPGDDVPRHPPTGHGRLPESRPTASISSPP